MTLPFTMPPDDETDPVTDALAGPAAEIDPYTLELIRRASEAGMRQKNAAGAVERALVRRAQAEQGLGDARGVNSIPTPFGAVVLRKSPIEKLAALGRYGFDAYRGYKAEKEKVAADADVDSIRTDYAGAVQRGGGSVEQALEDQANAGLAGLASPVLDKQAGAYLEDARRRQGRADQEKARRDEILLKRSLWGQAGGASRDLPIDQKLLALAPELGLDAEALSAMPPKQASNIVAQRLVQRAAEADKAARLTTPEAVAEKRAVEEARRLDAEVKRASLEEKRTAAANRPAEGEADLRKEWIGQAPYKNAQASLEMFRKMETASDTAAGDISRIYAYMKMLDPGSMVKESEYATAQNSGGIPERVRNAYNKAIDGQRLTPEQRAGFTTEARSILTSTLDAYEANAETYRRIAKSRGFNVDNVVPTMKVLGSKPGIAPVKAGIPASAPPSAKRPQRTVNGETREWNGTAWVPVGSP